MSKKKTRSDIGKKVFMMAAVSILLITVVFVAVRSGMNGKNDKYSNETISRETIVRLNEIEKALESGDSGSKEMIDELMISLEKYDEGQRNQNITYLWVSYGLSVAAIVLVYFAVYILILRPFAKLEAYAGDIAAGNLDKELKYERVNVFGQFTWAFDHMRREIKRARRCEQEAVENNKTVIATLSHDIKTPIASIRAYSEALSQNMDSSEERRERYLEVIIRKCDEVTKITNDMFIHSLHDLDKLVMKKENAEIHKVIYDTVSSMQGDREDVIFDHIEECTLAECDKDRVAQVLENLINNARKYAPGDIHISGYVTADEEVGNAWAGLSSQVGTKRYVISVKDSGSGIADEDMPFIFEKFYRGKNSEGKPGAGLGLFIVKYIMEQIGGGVLLTNHTDGMEIKLFFEKIIS